MNRPTLRQRFKYWFDNLMSRGTGALVLVLAVVVAVAATVGVAIAAAGRETAPNGTLPPGQVSLPLGR